MIFDRLLKSIIRLNIAYRPFEVNWELDNLPWHGCSTVVSQHRGEPFAKGALVFGIDGGLIMFQANSESGCTNSGTHPRCGFVTLAAVSHGVFAKFVFKTF